MPAVARTGTIGKSKAIARPAALELEAAPVAPSEPEAEASVELGEVAVEELAAEVGAGGAESGRT